MLRSRWLLSRCLGQPLRTAARTRGQLRFQSTASHDAETAISPLLINRARSIAAEHAKLSARVVESYDVDTAKKLGELTTVTTVLKDWDDARNSLAELNALLEDASTDTELRTLAEHDIETTTAALSHHSTALKTSLIPPHPFARLPCLIELHPGAGGSEASLFAHTLLNMYTALCNRLDLPCTLTSYTADDSVSSTTPGLTSAVLEVNHPGAYDLLRTEAGVHRVQRVPTTEKKGRVHTSAVSVLVMPSFPSSSSSSSSSSPGEGGGIDVTSPTSDYYIDPSTVRSQTMRASGAGGQHVNKTDSAVRLTHLPTNTVVGPVQQSRSQHKNREIAWTLLRGRLAQMKREAREREMAALRRKVMGGVARTGREDKVRTYNFVQGRVTDHRCGVERGLEGVLEGGSGLEGVMDGVRGWMVEGEVEGLVAEEEEESRKVEGG